MSSIKPVITPLADLALRAWVCLQLAYYRRALAERVHPRHPDRHFIELRIMQLESSYR